MTHYLAGGLQRRRGHRDGNRGPRVHLAEAPEEAEGDRQVGVGLRVRRTQRDLVQLQARPLVGTGVGRGGARHHRQVHVPGLDRVVARARQGSREQQAADHRGTAMSPSPRHRLRPQWMARCAHDKLPQVPWKRGTIDEKVRGHNRMRQRQGQSTTGTRGVPEVAVP